MTDRYDSAAIPASLEMLPRHVLDAANLVGLFPPATRVYLPDTGSHPGELAVAAARRLTELGYTPVPHLAARRLTAAEVERRVAALTGEAGVRDVLVIGGGLDKPVGAFDSAMSLIESGVLDRHGIARIAVGGHPEGSPDFPEQAAYDALVLKQAFRDRTDADMLIVTQFGFDGDAVIRWLASLERYGVDLPVHVGVAGPCKVSTLIKYAAACGVGNALQVVRKQGSSILALAAGFSPESVVEPVERRWRAHPGSALRQIHVFTFGGATRTAEWLRRRGSWGPAAGSDDGGGLDRRYG